MTQFTYRLQPLLDERDRIRKEAEAELTRQEHELEAQLKVLQSLQARVKELGEKREQARREMLSKPDEGKDLTAREVLERSEFVKVLGRQIQDAEDDVRSQRGVIETCEAQVQAAKKHVEEARREVEVLTKHREKQQERFIREIHAKEELALDEIGNVLYATRRRPT